MFYGLGGALDERTWDEDFVAWTRTYISMRNAREGRGGAWGAWCGAVSSALSSKADSFRQPKVQSQLKRITGRAQSGNP